MHTNLLRHCARLPVIREVLGAGSGVAVALTGYYVFEFVRGMVGVETTNAVGTSLHGAASLLAANGTVTLGLGCTLALAGTCAFLHRRTMMSEID